MQRILRRFILIGLVWTCAAGSALAYAPTDPNFLSPEYGKDWKTLETPHFSIHHVASNKEFARRLGAIAERVHDRLSTWLGWQPWLKTQVVILDSIDLSNGATTVIPYNQFYIYMPTPVEGEIMDDEPWLELVFTHEYTHVLHLDMVSVFPKIARYIFGRALWIPPVTFTFPNMYVPSWEKEGLAVYSESNNKEGFGRLNNAWYEAMMRMEVQRGLRTLTEVSYDGYSCSRWPCGQNYLYGAYFFKFIEEKYGRDQVADYVKNYSSDVIPWRLDRRSQVMFGKPMRTVWEEYQDYLRQRFEPQLAAIAKKSGARTRTVYDTPYFNNMIAPAGNGDLFFYHDDESSHQKIYRLHADGSTEALFDANQVMDLDWQDNAGMLLSQLAVCDNVKAYADLYHWQPGMSKPERLTHCGRYPIAAWRPDGQAIAAVQLDGGLSRLVLLDAHGGQAQTLSQFPVGDALGQIAWSPDGNRIVASVKRLHTGWNLELFDIATRQWQTLTMNRDLEIRPRFSADGRSIYFLSDHDKIWNLRRITLGSNRVETMSNTLSAIEEAVAMPDGSYRMEEYTAHGQAIVALDQPQRIGRDYAARANKIPEIKAISTARDFQLVPYDNVHDYSALSTMWPRYWMPLSVANADTTSYAGVYVEGADVLGFHSWIAEPVYYYDIHQQGGYLAYDFYNTLTFAVLRQFIAHSNTAGTTQYRDDETRFQALVGHTFNSFDSSKYIAAGVTGEHIKSTVYSGSGPTLSSRDTLAGAIARYDDANVYLRSISPVNGRKIQLSGETYDALGNNFYSGKTYRLDWREYLGFGNNQALMLRWQRAQGDPTIRPYFLGGELPPSNPLGTDIELGRRNFELRGYASGSPSLIGTSFTIATAEWRIPLGMVFDGWFDKSWHSIPAVPPPMGIGRHSLTMFMDSGDAWNKGEPIRWKTGAGIEYNVEALVGYDLLHLGITVGYAHGFDKKEGKNRLYLRAWLPF